MAKGVAAGGYAAISRGFTTEEVFRDFIADPAIATATSHATFPPLAAAIRSRRQSGFSLHYMEEHDVLGNVWSRWAIT